MQLVAARLPALPLPAGAFDAVIANSLLHHLPDPLALWRELARVARPGAVIHVMDLTRPASPAAAWAIVEAAAGGADPLLTEDFSGHLACRVVSERHLRVSGRL